MALTLRILGIGQFDATTERTLVPGTVNKGTLIQSICLTNTSTTNSVTVNGIWVKVANPAGVIGATQKRLVSPQNFLIAPNAQWILTSDITLGSTPAPNSLFGTAVLDTLVAQVGTANLIDYVVNGMERDV